MHSREGRDGAGPLHRLAEQWNNWVIEKVVVEEEMNEGVRNGGARDTRRKDYGMPEHEVGGY